MDTDSDGLGNVCDADDDDDTVPDTGDNCVLVKNTNQLNIDGDAFGDVCDPTPNGDNDYDGVDDGRDNCKAMWNPDQLDGDKDGVGNACDMTADNDTIVNSVDNCLMTPNMDQNDPDHDTVGDVCDNAPTIPNCDQADTDGDRIPDVLDPDDDNDGVLDGADNCRTHANPKQEDSNRNGIGDACESRLVPDKDIYEVFRARDKYFERFQILVDPCATPSAARPAGSGNRRSTSMRASTGSSCGCSIRAASWLPTASRASRSHSRRRSGRTAKRRSTSSTSCHHQSSSRATSTRSQPGSHALTVTDRRQAQILGTRPLEEAAREGRFFVDPNGTIVGRVRRTLCGSGLAAAL